MLLNIVKTGSKGNLLLLSGLKEKILIEQGLRVSEINKAVDFNYSDIVCGLLSHEHKDHSKSTVEIAKKGIPIYASAGTIKNLDGKSSFLYPVKSQQIVETDEFKILFFDVQHDSIEPLGFLIYSKIEHKKILFATDTYFLKYKFHKVDYFILEVNYINSFLMRNVKSGRIPEVVKNRVVKSHFGLKNVIEFLNNSDLSIAKKIFPIHLSDNNSSLSIIKNKIENETGVGCCDQHSGKFLL